MKITLTKEKGPKISKYIYGHFAEHLGRCIYDGLYVGKDSSIPNVNGMRSDVVEALKNIKVPVLRWPGGCFADEYHWKDGIGPKENRKKIVNTHWGGVTENNHFGTHEYFELIKQLGCDAYINGNVGSGTVQEMQEWVEYMTMGGESPMANWRRENGRDEPWKVKFFGVGNESWGCGGNMRPDYYADEYRRYQTYVRQYGEDKIYKIACGPNIDDYHWMDRVMSIAAPFMDGISLHHYALTGEWEDKGPALGFNEEQWWSLLASAKKMDDLITKHSTIMDKYDPEKRVGLIVDEWGSWLSVEPGTNPGFLYQQNTIRDAMVAALTLNIFHKHADRVHMANIAQTVNVLQAMILTEGDKMVKTPSYHVFDLYKVHQDAEVVASYGDSLDTLSYTVSKKDGMISISLCNYSLTDNQTIDVVGEFGNKITEARYITADEMDAHNDFEHPENIIIKAFDGASLKDGNLSITMPKMSVATIRIPE
ncbi:alpha-N-arabinofuranosidase [Streptococcus gallolyticus]|uniref:non-reducing end alpha-L-arabinofuranosidase n=1 Tax=Streptococcus gallolyticus TaxID=315405 RepID=A0A1H7W7G2_9STRE|nr:alpha-N-arabinofuranosidase [Streptococcus gallolyticus]MCQ9216443.1 alpha-N-arabinofuranosidase [Streptococcus gallolyticus]SEF22883.1 alpha-N-arabinofuranosidase [Streptococcus gallolyticus]SEM17542.1 alpha-N-arabinofuranosidase [Streptococcus gallolyticus]